MNITSHYNPSQGLMVVSPSGSQKYTEYLNSYSSVISTIKTSNFNNNNKFAVDSCWESGNIYYANYDLGYVKKIKYDGTELYSLALTNPFMVSIIQNSSKMATTINYPPQDERGCWIADKGTGKIIKTDNQLNILLEVGGMDNAVGLVADIDGGCYVVEQHTTPSAGGNLIRISASGQIIGIKNYSSFSPVASKFIDISVNSSGLIWFCANDVLYYLNSILDIGTVISPLSVDDPFSSSSSEHPVEEEMHVGGIDIDRRDSDNLYITGGNSYQSFVIKYSSGGEAVLNEKQYFDISYPYVIKAIQGMGSDSLYLLEDSAKWDDYGYGSSSSSSSSSSTEIRSSSSSSSSSTEIRSSSSSSSSSP